MIEPGDVPLERVLGPDVGGIYANLHREHGVELLTATGLAGFEGKLGVERAVTTDGRKIDCDFVVVGIGVEPRTALATTAGLLLGRGVTVDELQRTSDPAIFAALRTYSLTTIRASASDRSACASTPLWSALWAPTYSPCASTSPRTARRRATIAPTTAP